MSEPFNAEVTVLIEHRKLVAVFNAIDTIVIIAVGTQVDPFLDQIAAMISTLLSLRGYTFGEYTSIVRP